MPALTSLRACWRWCPTKRRRPEDPSKLPAHHPSAVPLEKGAGGDFLPAGFGAEGRAVVVGDVNDIPVALRERAFCRLSVLQEKGREPIEADRA